jgi:putative addiction module component (TIGR02574 family)
VSTLMPEIARLTLAERIQLVEDLWDSIAAEASQSLKLTEDPGAAIPWAQVRAELSGRAI